MPTVPQVLLDLRVHPAPPAQQEVMAHLDLQGRRVPMVLQEMLDLRVQRVPWDHQVQTAHRVLPVQWDQQVLPVRPALLVPMAQRVQLEPPARPDQ